jgi:hypothetical protein
MTSRWLLLILCISLLAASCNPTAEVADTCSARAKASGNPNQLFYCPESFEGPLAAPSPDKGYQLKYGPRQQTADEEEMCLTVSAEDAQARNIKQYVGRMSPGSHHFLLYRTDVDLPDNVYYPCFAGYPKGGAEAISEFAAAGITNEDFAKGTLSWLAGLQAPGGLATPDYEEKGMAFALPAKVQLIMNVHYIKVIEEPINQEVWINVLYVEDPSKIKEEIAFITFIGAPLVIPARAEDYELPYHVVMPQSEMDDLAAESGKAVDQIKIHLLTAHAHRRLTRFDIDIVRADGTEERVYQTHSWYEPDYEFYDPPLLLNRKDKIRFVCTYDNPYDFPVYLGETVEDEMCNVFGAYSPNLGGNWLNGSILK